MFAIQAVNGSTSKHAFSVDWGMTTIYTGALVRDGKEHPSRVIVEPGTRNLYIVGKRGTQPTEETTPGGASANHWAERAFLLKLDKQGNVLWNRELNKDGMQNDPNGQTWRRYSRFDDVCINSLTGDVYVVGYTDAHYGDHYEWIGRRGDCLVAKYSSSGTLQWQKFYGRNLTEWGQGVTWYPSGDEFNQCFPFSDGRFVAAGPTTNHDGGYVHNSINWNAMLTAWNSNGTVSWSKWISVDGTQNNTSSNVSTTIWRDPGMGVDGSDNVYMLVFRWNPADTGDHVIKFNSSGTVQWKKKIDHLAFEKFYDHMAVSKSGDVYIQSSDSDKIVKLNTSGTVQWTKSFPGVGANGINQMTTDEYDNLWLAGYTGEAVCVDSNGNIIRAVQMTTSSAGIWFTNLTINEGYITMLTQARTLGRNQSNMWEANVGVIRGDIYGLNNGSYTHTNSDNTTLTVTISTPSTSSPTNYSNPTVSNSSASVIDYPGSGSVRLNNGSCTSFTNSSPFHSATLTV